MFYIINFYNIFIKFIKINVIIIIINKVENLLFRFFKNIKIFTFIKIILIINYFITK